MAAYVIGMYDVTNPEGYQAYQEAAGPTLAQYGAELVVADSDTEVLEGKQPSQTVVLRFEDEAAARRWYESSEYQQAKRHRVENSENGVLLIASGFEVPS